MISGCGKAPSMTAAPVNQEMPSYEIPTAALPHQPFSFSLSGGALYAQAKKTPTRVAANAQIPSARPSRRERPDQIIARYRPHWPGIRPDGIGRFGSLIASTCRSYQSFTAWLEAHTIGPASSMPPSRRCMFPKKGWPLETAPHMKAHIAANQVTGLKSSSTAAGFGSWWD